MEVIPLDHQFIITPNDIYKFILAICGFIVSVTGAIKIIMNIIEKAKEPDKIQNDRITSLDNRVSILEKNQSIFKKNQKRAEEALVLYMEALLQLTNHMIDGNHIENLKDVRNKMQDFITKNSMILEETDDEK